MTNTLTVDINGAAELLKIHPQTVLDLINAGTLPAARVGRAYVLMTKDVMAHIEQLVINQTAEKLVIKGRRCRVGRARARPTLV